MSKVLDELVSLLTLEPIEENLFRGPSQDLGWGTVYGGQVLGQALSAAARTAPPDREVHSLHAYFLRPGDVKKPIVYEVDRIRDGGSFTTRRVVAIQSGQPIFNVAASFQRAEPGFEHQDEMPDVPPPESLPTEQERAKAHGEGAPEFIRKRAMLERPFEIRAADDPDHLVSPTKRAATRRLWLRTADRVADSSALHACLLAYASDYAFLTTALFPHGVTWLTPGMQVASIDHVMWFHRPFRADEWLLHVMESPAAQSGRALVRGRVFTRDGKLVATTAQEGLVRKKTRG